MTTMKVGDLVDIIETEHARLTLLGTSEVAQRLEGLLKTVVPPGTTLTYQWVNARVVEVRVHATDGGHRDNRRPEAGAV